MAHQHEVGAGMSVLTIPVPLVHEESMMVDARHTVPQVADWEGFKGMPYVLATAMMIGFVEQTCVQGLAPYLPPGSITVGTHVDMSHVAASPIGSTITARVELVETTKRSLVFAVSCRDQHDVVIGKGTHRRALVDRQRFIERLDSAST